MPVTPTYPGVYIEELPSGNQTITGVATSITAFVGRAHCGPVNEPMTIFSFGDYERFFGGLGSDYPMSFAVYDFFTNGGSQAIIVRLFGSTALADALSTTATSFQALVDAFPASPAPTLADVTGALGKAAANPPAVAAETLATIEAAAAAETKKATPPDVPTLTKTINDLLQTAISAASGVAVTPGNQGSADWTKAMTTLKGTIDALTNGAAADKTPAKVKATLQTAVANAAPGSADAVAAKTLLNYTTAQLALKTPPDFDALLKGLDAKALSPGAAPSLPLVAQSPGIWGNYLSASIDRVDPAKNPLKKGDPAFDQKFGRYGIKPEELFNLTITYAPPVGQPVAERFLNLSATGGTGGRAPCRYDRVLQGGSLLVEAPDGVVFSGLDPLIADILPFDSNSGVDSEGLSDDDYTAGENTKTGIYALKKVDLFNLLCIPPDTAGEDTHPSVYLAAAGLCQKRRAFLIIDPPSSWAGLAEKGQISEIQPTDPELGVNGELARYAAVYFPRVLKEDPTMQGQVSVFPACGIIAGVMASTDLERGVWKAPAGQNAGISGITGLEVNLTDDENGQLNPLGINCLRSFPILGPVVWGARTLRGADQLSDDYRYVSVRRLANYIEESLYRGTHWAVFEPNDERLWSSLRLSIGGFMADLSRQGAFYSYNVACDKTTTTQQDIEQGIVRVLVTFAPVDPAEFVIITIQQQLNQAS